MSQNFQSTGTKISQYPFAEVNTSSFKKKLELSHKFISYAEANYGASNIRKNYQISIEALRDDFLGFIGITNSKAAWRDLINVWEGDWYNMDRVRSYVTPWLPTEFYLTDYIPNKYGLDKKYDVDNNIHRIFMLNTAPWPLEATDRHFSSEEDKNYGEDPNPHSVRFVSKNYVDDRHSGFRKVDVQDYGLEHPSHLTIRPYTCFYQYTELPEQDENGCYYVDICDDCVLEDGSTFHDKVRYNRLVFYLRFKNHPEFYVRDGVHCNNLKILVNGEEDVVRWSYEDEWTEILREFRLKTIDGEIQNTQKEYLFLKCEGEYIDGKFVVTGSSFFGRKKAIKRMIEIPVTDNGIVDIDLSLHENECFVTQVPLDDLTNNEREIYRDQTIINFDVSKLDDYHLYSWDYFLITPDDTPNDNRWDYSKVVFGGTPIMWANQDNFNISPEFQPNKMYCLEFVKAFDGVLIGRIKYFVSLIKKS